MVEDLNSSRLMYAFCRVIDPKTTLPKYVIINWVKSLSRTERQIWLPNSEVETASPKGSEGTASLYFRVG